MKLIRILFAALVLSLTSCKDDAKKKKKSGEESESTTIQVKDTSQSKGVGPITSITLEAIDNELAANGKQSYDIKCVACHSIESKLIGPALKDVTKRRTPEWIMNMIINPQEMVQKDPIAKKLFIESNNAMMINQNIKEEEARALLEYLRTI